MLAMKSRLSSTLVVALLALVFSGCATDFSQKEALFSLGMPKSEVVSILSENVVRTAARDGREYVIYKAVNTPPRYVEFEDGKLMGWGAWNWGADSPKSDKADRIEIESDSTIKIE
jgi:hypothetical protein